MKRPNPVRELERRTAAGEIAPIPAAGRWNGDRARRAALAQLRLRSRTSESGPVPRMLAEVRRIFVESAICETPDVLARMVPDDAFRIANLFNPRSLHAMDLFPSFSELSTVRLVAHATVFLVAEVALFLSFRKRLVLFAATSVLVLSAALFSHLAVDWEGML